MTEGFNLKLEDILRHMVQCGASDVHIKAGSPPGFRIDGSIITQDHYGVLDMDDTRTLAYQILREDQIKTFENVGDLDLSYAVAGAARFRVNVLTQREAVGVVIRQIPDRIPTMNELRLPKICSELAARPRGLVLVTGPTGSGKSTTLASMINHINETTRGHILTMEDPLEFLHEDRGCFVTQRQIGTDCQNFQAALRRALRQDPDVILIGEMRDLETIELAITAAETGHLVLGTLHTTSAISTVDRIIDVFPPDSQQQVRIQLATTLQGVISQTLCPKVGGGRVPAHEILVATDGVRSLIREGKTPQILNFLQTGSKYGMITLEQSLTRLVEDGLVYSDQARAKANRPEEIPEGKYKDRRAKPDADPAARPPGMRRRSTDPGGPQSRRSALASLGKRAPGDGPDSSGPAADGAERTGGSAADSLEPTGTPSGGSGEPTGAPSVGGGERTGAPSVGGGERPGSVPWPGNSGRAGGGDPATDPRPPGPAPRRPQPRPRSI